MKTHASQAAGMLKLLANSHRLMILCSLVQQERSVGQLIEITKLSQSSVSQHLAKMRNEGLVSGRKLGQQVYYRIAKHEVEAILSTLYLIYCNPQL